LSASAEFQVEFGEAKRITRSCFRLHARILRYFDQMRIDRAEVVALIGERERELIEPIERKPLQVSAPKVFAVIPFPFDVGVEEMNADGPRTQLRRLRRFNDRF